MCVCWCFILVIKLLILFGGSCVSWNLFFWSWNFLYWLFLLCEYDWNLMICICLLWSVFLRNSCLLVMLLIFFRFLMGFLVYRYSRVYWIFNVWVCVELVLEFFLLLIRYVCIGMIFCWLMVWVKVCWKILKWVFCGKFMCRLVWFWWFWVLIWGVVFSW